MLRLVFFGILAANPATNPVPAAKTPAYSNPALAAGTQSNDAEGAPLSFASDVAPVLQKHCVRCHNDEDESGGLRLDNYEAVMRGGDRGPAVVARNPGISVLFQKVIRKDRPSMPPKKTLPSPDVKVIRTWIQTGARR